MLSSAEQDAATSQSAFMLLFPHGERPDQKGIVSLFAGELRESLGASLSHVPDEREGWVEILASGLTFDLQGLGPGQVVAAPRPGHFYGFNARSGGLPILQGDVLSLGPAGHIAGGAGMAPVIRTMAGLAANLAMDLPVSAVFWPPARSVIEPAFFARTIFTWLGGGAFPALGLTSLAVGPDGSVASIGLSFFTGVEMQMEAGAGGDAAGDMKLALRVIDHLVTEGIPPQDAEVQIAQTALILEPSRQGKRVWVWRAE